MHNQKNNTLFSIGSKADASQIQASMMNIGGFSIVILLDAVNNRLWRKPHFIRTFSQMCSPDIASGGYDRGGGAGKCKIFQECFKNLFLSISYENTQTTVVRSENGLNHPS